ncbi:MAG: hypothetical protein Q4D06_07855 [Coriobacteriia bacterium]|nr:hypothetical protein [Coriobacteriia bacterium]
MPDVLVRGLDEATKSALAAMAAENGRSLQAQLRLILSRAAQGGLHDDSGRAAPTSAEPLLFEDEPTEVVEQRIAKRRRLHEQAQQIRASLPADMPSLGQMLAEARAERDGGVDEGLQQLTWPNGDRVFSDDCLEAR